MLTVGGTIPGVRLNPRYTFARLITGRSNELAVASAVAVAAAPGRGYNPLFVYGETGLGKSHLMQAVAHEVVARDAAARRPATRLIYVSAEEFLNDIVAAVQQGTDAVAAERGRYQRADLLLIDDVHVLAGRRGAQEMFAEIFATLYESRRQIMMTSDRPPQSIGLDAALVSQFRWGRVVDVSRPDAGHRLAILRAKIRHEHRGVPIPDDVVSALADGVFGNTLGNVRAMEGALTRLAAYAALKRQPVTLAIARELLGAGELFRAGPPRAAGAAAIEHAVAVAWGPGDDGAGAVTPEAMLSKRRTKEIVEPRQVAMYLCRELLGMTLSDIGLAFGGRDHSTVIHGVEKVRSRLIGEPVFRARVEALRRQIEGAIQDKQL
jgi:chromosomal replication initiator protein